MPHLPTWPRSCNPGQPSPAWEALHCYEGDQRCTGHGRAFVAWHGTVNICENNSIIEDSLMILGVHAPFPSVWTLDWRMHFCKHVRCQSLPELFAVVPCLFAYTGAQIKTMRYLETIVAGQLQALRTEYLEPWRPPAFWNRLGQLCLAEIQVVSAAMLAIGVSHVSIKPTNLAIFYSVHT